MTEHCADVRHWTERILQESLPILGRRAARKKLLGNLSKERQQIASSDARYADWFQLKTNTLDDLIQKERDRAKALDEKAGKITAVLAIALTIGSTFAKSIVDNVSTPWLKISVEIGLLLSMAYVLMGGLIGLFSGMSAKPQGGYGPDWEVELIKANDAPKYPRIQVLIEFEITNIIRNNDISSALSCVRNGVIIFSIVMPLAISDPLVAAIFRAPTAFGCYLLAR